METLLVLLIIVLIVGALLGGNSFGGSIRKGCGCFVYVAIALAVVILLGLILSSLSTSESGQEVQIDDNSTHFISIDNCPIYSKPNIKSDTTGLLEVGREFFGKNADRFKYFYKITDEHENRVYVRKNCLERK